MIRATMFGEHSIMSSEMDLQNRHCETKLSTKVTHPLKGGKFENKETSKSLFFQQHACCKIYLRLLKAFINNNPYKNYFSNYIYFLL
jgi:hypothetical protein